VQGGGQSPHSVALLGKQPSCTSIPGGVGTLPTRTEFPRQEFRRGGVRRQHCKSRASTDIPRRLRSQDKILSESTVAMKSGRGYVTAYSATHGKFTVAVFGGSNRVQGSSGLPAHHPVRTVAGSGRSRPTIRRRTSLISAPDGDDMLTRLGRPGDNLYTSSRSFALLRRYRS